MSDQTIESLRLEINTEANNADQGIKALSESLGKLRESLKGGVGLTSVANQMTKVANAANAINSGSVNNINKLADSLAKLKSIGTVKVSSSIATQLVNIGSAADAIKDVEFSNVEKLATALAPLQNVSKASGLNSTINALKKLPELSSSLHSMNIDGFATDIQKLTSALSPLATQLDKISSTYSKLPSKLSRMTSETEKAETANKTYHLSLTDIYHKLKLVYRGVSAVMQRLGSWVDSSNQYIESLNLFTASMGEYAEEAKRYAEEVGEALGIDPSEWMRGQGTFNTIIKGFGVASDKAELMSRNLTQLGYDISSFFNMSVEESMQKLQSGISGELEPLRRLGYDLSVARLQQEAYNLGIKKSVSSMTQAEKSQLRYYAIMTQVTMVQGDMARTLNAPANQLRIFKAQVTQAGRAIGNIFIPMLNAVLPYAIAVTKVLREMATYIANLVGFTLPEVDYSGVSGAGDATGELSDSLADATENAKKLKSNLLGIDELNVISPDDSSSGSSGGSTAGSGGDLGIELPQYDFLSGLVESRVNQIVETIKEKLEEIAAIVSVAFLAVGAIIALTGVNIPLGIALMAAGAVGLVTVHGLNWDSMDESLKSTLTALDLMVGGFLLGIGAVLTFSGTKPALGIAMMAGGAVALATATALNWGSMQNSLTKTLSLLEYAIGGFLLGIGAVLAFTGAKVGLGVALMAAGAVTLGTAVVLNWGSLTGDVSRTIKTIEMVVGGAFLAIGALLALTHVNLPLGLALIVAGATSLGVSQIPINWSWVGQKLKSVLTAIGGFAGSALAALGAILLFAPVSNAIGVAMLVAGVGMTFGSYALGGNAMKVQLTKWMAQLLHIVALSMLAIGVILLFNPATIGIGIAAIAGAIGLEAMTLDWNTIWNTIKGGLESLGKRIKGWWDDLIGDFVEGWNDFWNWITGSNPDQQMPEYEMAMTPDGYEYPVLKIPAELEMTNTVDQAVGYIPTEKVPIRLEKSNWTSVSQWVGNIPVLKQSISLTKAGWNKVSDLVGAVPTVQQKVALQKQGWDTVPKWIGSSTVNASVNLVKGNDIYNVVPSQVNVGVNLVSGSGGSGSGQPNLNKWLAQYKAMGGIFSHGSWKDIPQYASGTLNAGSLFVAGEAGAEVVGHIGGQTEVLNQSQIATAMKSAVTAGMSQYVPIWRGIFSQMTVAANGVINAVAVSASTLEAAYNSSNSYIPQADLSASMSDVTSGSGVKTDDAAFSEAMRTFYMTYMEPTMRSMATDMKRQADKEETTVVRMNSREVAKEIKKQNVVNGYSFS